MSGCARKASFLAQESDHFLAGKVTAVLQLTDIDVAFLIKAAANRGQQALRRELREKAIEEKTPCVFKRGPYEVLRLTYEAIKHVAAAERAGAVLVEGVEEEWLPGLSSML